MDLRIEINLNNQFKLDESKVLLEKLQVHMKAKFDLQNDIITVIFFKEVDPDLKLKSMFARLIEFKLSSETEISINITSLKNSDEDLYPINFDYVLLNYFGKYKTNLEINYE